MQGILIATLVVGVVGLVLGLALVTASKKFYVETDERVTQVRECLRGANCGACGYAGCDAVAEAIVKGENIPKPGVPESFKVLVKELQALCLDIRVLDEQGNEIELREDDDDDDVIYTSGDNEEVVVGDTNEVLDSGFVIDEDGPEDIMDVVFSDLDNDDADPETSDD